MHYLFWIVLAQVVLGTTAMSWALWRVIRESRRLRLITTEYKRLAAEHGLAVWTEED